MTNKLSGLKVAILATDGFEQSELFEPKKALEEAGAQIQIVSLKSGEIKGWNEKNWGDSITVDATVGEVSGENYDALVLPGGVMNPDKLRVDDNALKFVKSFFEAGKPVGAICHAPWTLINAGVVNDRQMTSYHSIKQDLINAGAQWVDMEVVVDNGLVTSRRPGDLPVFNEKIIAEFAQSRHKKEKSAAL
jgi:protease I